MALPGDPTATHRATRGGLSPETACGPHTAGPKRSDGSRASERGTRTSVAELAEVSSAAPGTSRADSDWTVHLRVAAPSV